MKQSWLKLAARIDVLTLRQRVGLFAACAFVVLYLFYLYAFAPLLREQTRLRAQISQQQTAMAGIDGQLTSLVDALARDPDATSRTRLAAARLETRTLGDSLAAMQKGLVAPEQMTPLLQSMLRANGRLQLVALTTLPLTEVGRAAGADPAAPADPVKAAAAGLLYRHGVQVTVRGSYLDMIDYMAALENLPTQLFWGPAQFAVEDYPRAHVTLTLYTLSLDSKWLKL
jgi:MSHA biogenesis protein MshJ